MAMCQNSDTSPFFVVLNTIMQHCQVFGKIFVTLKCYIFNWGNRAEKPADK